MIPAHHHGDLPERPPRSRRSSGTAHIAWALRHLPLFGIYRSRSKIEEKSVIAARSRASRSLASALHVGALARGLLRLTVHGNQNWRRWGHAD
jgi:hypothetical protein